MRALAAIIAVSSLVTLARAQEPNPPVAPTPTTDAPQPLPSQTAPLQQQRLGTVQIEGKLNDSPKNLARFLGLESDEPFGESEQDRLGADLERLGYRATRTFLEPAGTGHVNLRLVVEPVRVVRNIVVKGNWPLFDDEVIRHLTVRTGQRLPADAELRTFLDDEAETIRKFLANEGYFEAAVSIEPRQAVVFSSTRGILKRGPRADWVDLVIRVHLGASYRLGSVVATYDHPDGAAHMSEAHLFDIFTHILRFKVTEMREDARKAEKELHDAGFPAARVLPHFDFDKDADRRTNRIRLSIQVLVKRRVEVSFVGNHSLSDRELRDQLTIYAAGAYDEVELAESAKAIQRAYQKRGYFEAQVTFRRNHKKSDGEDVEEVVYTIVEGPELRVQKVEVVSDGDKPLSFASDELRDKADLETKPYPTLGAIGFGEGGYVTATQLSQDAERLAAVYRNRGYPSVKVRPEVARDQAAFTALGAFGAEVTGAAGASRDLYVRFLVDEGRHEVVDHVEIDFVGPHVKNELDVYKALTLGAGSSYTAQGEANNQQKMLELYKASGHPYVQIDVTPSTWNKPHDLVVLRYVIDEGPAVKFGAIIIRGNFKTRDYVIRRDLPFKEGEPFDYAKRELAERNLQTHGLFNAVSVTPVGLNEGRNPVPILINVQERYLEGAGSLTIGFGGATDKIPDYLYVFGSYLWPNLFGSGSQLEIKGDYAWLAAVLSNPVTWGLSLRYSDARIFGPGWRLDITGSYRNEDTNRFGLITTFGASLGLTRNLTQALRAFIRYDIYKAAINVGFLRLEGPNSVGPDLSVESVPDNTLTTRAVAGIFWDRRVGIDGTLNPLAPVKGWLLSAELIYAHDNWITHNPFVMVSGQALGMLPFKIRGVTFTLIANGRYDEGFPIGESALPLVERLFAGGDTTTRGFDTDTLKNEVVRYNASPLGGAAAFRIVPEGGNLRLLNTIELQYPIAKSLFGMPWVGAIFWDVGAIANGLDQLRASDLRTSIGVTILRILTPVGPLSLEYAYPLNQTVAEERWKSSPWYSHYPGRIHFNWGIPLSRL